MMEELRVVWRVEGWRKLGEKLLHLPHNSLESREREQTLLEADKECCKWVKAKLTKLSKAQLIRQLMF